MQYHFFVLNLFSIIMIVADLMIADKLGLSSLLGLSYQGLFRKFLKILSRLRYISESMGWV